MKYKARYSAESDIPDDVKAFYVMKDGEWVFNGAEFEGLDALLNPGLAANRDALKVEKQNEHTARKQAEQERDDANNLLTKASKPGTVHMDVAEQKLLDEYKVLGPIKDIKEKLDNEKIVSDKLTLLSTEKEVRQMAKDLGLNEDALVDFKLNSERGRNVILAAVKKKVKNAKGIEEEKLIPVVQITNNIDGKDKVTEKDFSEFAKENHYPEYLMTAIFNRIPETNIKDDKKSKFIAPPSMKEKTGDENSGRVDVKNFITRANDERSTRKVPWSIKSVEEKTET